MEQALLKLDIYKFLMVAYFGDCKDAIKAASNRAYRDLCRTIDSDEFINSSKSQRRTAREDVTMYLKEQIEKKLSRISIKNSQQAFDTWHKTTCLGIISSFSSCGNLHYGQAQKWLNMTCKYLCVLQYPLMGKAFHWLHVPIDNIILNEAQKQFSISHPSEPWSQWTYDTYIKYQKKLRDNIVKNKDSSPIVWEFEEWIKGRITSEN